MADLPRDGWTEKNERYAQQAGHEGWSAWCREREMELEKKICGRRNSENAPCGNPAGMGTDHPGQGACKYHGGLNPRGKEAGAYKHGKYVQGWSPFYPEGLKERVEQARQHSELEWLREIVPLLAARVGEKLEELQLQASPKRARELADATDRLLELLTQESPDPVELSSTIQEVRGLAAARGDEEEMWQDVYQLLEKLDRHTQSLWRILSEMRQLVRLEWVEDQLLLMVHEMKQAVREEVSDPAEQRSVLKRVARATGEWSRKHERRTTGRQITPADSREEHGQRQEQAVG